jgi:ATP-binding cassette, subfamily B, bacterial CvaB/MchF/RaxB
MDLDFGGSTRKLSLIMQDSNEESLMACIVMIATYYGLECDWNKIRKKNQLMEGWENQNTSINIADRLGMSIRYIKIETAALAKLELPSILRWDENQAVILSAINGDSFTLYDPSCGIKTIQRKELDDHFTGHVMECRQSNEFKSNEKGDKKLHLSDLWNNSKGLKTGLIQLFIISFMIEILTTSLPFLTQLIVDDVLVNNDYDLLALLGIGFSVIVVLRVITEYFRSYVLMFFGNKISFQFSLNICSHLLRLPVEFFDSRHMGDVVSRYNSANEIKDFLTSSVVVALVDGVMVLGTLALMLMYSPLLTMIALLSILIYGVIRISMYHSFFVRNEEKLIAYAEENSNFMENVSGILSIKLFGKEANRLSLWQSYLVKALNSGIRLQRLVMLNTFFNGLLYGMEMVLIAYLGAHLVLEKEMSAGMLLAFFSHKDNLLQKSFRLLDTIVSFKMLNVHLARISDIALTKKEQCVERKSERCVAVPSKSFFEVRNVAFKYEKNKNFLFHNISLQADKEESICIIGASGCGKSTLIRVLASLYSPTSGDIHLEGVSVNDLGLREFRNNIGAVLQNDILLQGTIADNICFFDSMPDYDRIQHASKLAAIHENILEKTEQYETRVGNLGVGLSGGEVQRILIARALYKQPKILFLDEATSHLDMETERQVNKAICEMKITRIMVAHRLETIRTADKIFQLTPTGLLPVMKDSIEIGQFK